MLVCKHEYDVILWRHVQRTPNTNYHHMPLNETPHENFLRTPLRERIVDSLPWTLCNAPLVSSTNSCKTQLRLGCSTPALNIGSSLSTSASTGTSSQWDLFIKAIFQLGITSAPQPSQGRHSWLNAGVEVFPPIAHFHSVNHDVYVFYHFALFPCESSDVPVLITSLVARLRFTRDSQVSKIRSTVSSRLPSSVAVSALSTPQFPGWNI